MQILLPNATAVTLILTMVAPAALIVDMVAFFNARSLYHLNPGGDDDLGEVEARERLASAQVPHQSLGSAELASVCDGVTFRRTRQGTHTCNNMYTWAPEIS